MTDEQREKKNIDAVVELLDKRTGDSNRQLIEAFFETAKSFGELKAVKELRSE